MSELDKINSEIEATIALLKQQEQKRADMMIAAAPHKVGDIFTNHDQQYKVAKVIAPRLSANNRRIVWMDCHWQTSRKTWSAGTRTLYFEISL